MSDNNSHPVNHFRGRKLPEPATPAGYAALMDHYSLRLPLPPRLAAIAERHNAESTDEWLLYTPRHAPSNSLEGQLEFALKWEGVRLTVLSALFQELSSGDVAEVVQAKPTGRYARRIWFLYEWLTGTELDLPDAGKVRSVPVLDPDQQLSLESGELSSRHKVRNNLPGTSSFCPLVWKTERLDSYQKRNLSDRAREVIGRTHPDVLARTAAFLLLDDSRASFRIEGERPPHDRMVRWGQAIAQAGEQPLSIDELVRLQRIVIGDTRFVTIGPRIGSGFVGSHDRRNGDPIPEHISARAGDLQSLLDGLVEFEKRAVEGGMDPMGAAGCASFGFVYIHPFEDGNGRLHRWLIHHVLSEAGYNPPQVIFPVSAAILRNIAAYREVLRSYSQPLLSCCIDWRPTDKGNVEVLNDTSNYYRYFDATRHVEFLYECIVETIEQNLPDEVAYLEAFDRFAEGVERVVDMPDKTINLLHRFLQQGGGRLSKRAKTREFELLSQDEVEQIERLYEDCFPSRR